MTDLMETGDGLDKEDSEFLDTLEAKLVKKAKKEVKKKEEGERITYCFNYVDFPNHICINTLVDIDPMTGEKIPTFVVWDGQKATTCAEYRTAKGDLLRVPPPHESFYQDFYDDIIFPDTIIEDIVPSDVVDGKITAFLKAWNTHPEDYFVIARNYIKFTWIYERFYLRPYLFVYGDYGTGKSRWGKYITRLCQNGMIMEDVSAPTLARILQITNASAMLDELDKIDFNKEAEKLNTILRNGYQAKGRYRVAEQEGKNYKPSSFLVDQPKILVKRNMLRDDALASRVIPFKMTPRDKDLKDVMRSNDEAWWHEQRNGEVRAILNLLLRWRWQNIFLQENTLIVPGMMARFNDTLMPLLKMGNKQDREVMINYMRKQEKVAIDTASDDYRIQIIRILSDLVEVEKEKSLWGTPASMIMLSDVVQRAKDTLGADMTEFDFKRSWNPKYVKRSLMDLGFELETYRHKNYIKSESLADLLPRLTQKYNLKGGEDDEKNKDNSAVGEAQVVDNQLDRVIDTDVATGVQ